MLALDGAADQVHTGLQLCRASTVVFKQERRITADLAEPQQRLEDLELLFRRDLEVGKKEETAFRRVFRRSPETAHCGVDHPDIGVVGRKHHDLIFILSAGDKTGERDPVQFLLRDMAAALLEDRPVFRLAARTVTHSGGDISGSPEEHRERGRVRSQQPRTIFDFREGRPQKPGPAARETPVAGPPPDPDRDLIQPLADRCEKWMTTGVGNGLALPHIRVAGFPAPLVIVGRCTNPITDYRTLDNEPVRLIVFLAADEKDQESYLKILGSISVKLKDKALMDEILAAADRKAIFDILSR